MKKVTDKELLDILIKFDSDLEMDEEKIAEMSDKEKGELFLAVEKVLKYREDFPPDLAAAVQQLAKKAIEKQGIQKSDASSLNLNPDEDGIVLESGEIIEPGDELFPLAKSLSQMSAGEIEKLVDDLAIVTAHYCNVELMKKQLKLLKKKVSELEKKRGIIKDDDNKDKGTWPTVVNQM